MIWGYHHLGFLTNIFQMGWNHQAAIFPRPYSLSGEVNWGHQVPGVQNCDFRAPRSDAFRLMTPPSVGVLPMLIWWGFLGVEISPLEISYYRNMYFICIQLSPENVATTGVFGILYIYLENQLLSISINLNSLKPAIQLPKKMVH